MIYNRTEKDEQAHLIKVINLIKTAIKKPNFQ